MTTPVFLSTKALANLLGCSARSLEGARLRGDGPPFAKLGGVGIRYLLTDVEQWIASSRRASTADPGAASPRPRRRKVARG